MLFVINQFPRRLVPRVSTSTLVMPIQTILQIIGMPGIIAPVFLALKDVDIVSHSFMQEGLPKKAGLLNFGGSDGA
jgi:hypothetical protein